LPDDLLETAGAQVRDLAGPAETPGLRVVFTQLLDHVDRLHAEAADLPRRTQDRRLRLEVAVILGLSRRLTQRLRHGDPVATRVKLRTTDIAGSLLAALRWAA